MPAYSFSAIQTYQNCPKRYFHEKVAKDAPKMPESEQQQDGKRVHKALELRIKKGTVLPLDLKPLEPIMAKLDATEGTKYTEMKLAIDENLQPTGWFEKNVWFRSVIDLAIVKAPNAAVFDYKTGKVKEDFDQLNLSAVMLMHYEKEIEYVRAGYLWTNTRSVSPSYISRSDIMGIWGDILPVVETIENATRTSEFPAKPSGLCGWCPIRKCAHHPRHA